MYSQEIDKLPFVYKILIPIENTDSVIIQTGFMMVGTKGIVTTLHGLIGHRNYGAYNIVNDRLENLNIEMVDIENDLAIISNSELRQRSNEYGFKRSNQIPLAGQNLYVSGHPKGIELYTEVVTINVTPIKPLHTMLANQPSNIKDPLKKRKSPSDRQDVININAPLVEGFSGAPLFDADFYLYGVVFGGLLGGLAEICWAIPEANFRLIDKVREKFELDKLEGLNANKTFSLTVVVNPNYPDNFMRKILFKDISGDKILEDVIETDIAEVNSDYLISRSKLPQFLGWNIYRDTLDTIYSPDYLQKHKKIVVEERPGFRYWWKTFAWIPSAAYISTIIIRANDQNNYFVENSDKPWVYLGTVTPAIGWSLYRIVYKFFTGVEVFTPDWEWELSISYSLFAAADYFTGPGKKIDMFGLIKEKPEIPMIKDPPPLPLINLKFRF